MHQYNNPNLIRNTGTGMMFIPARDLIGARVLYRQATPSGLSAHITTGTILAIDPIHQQLRIQPDEPHRLTKWRTFDDIVCYLWEISE